jgi:hypothetical protein
LNNVAVSGGVAVIPEGSYADTLTGKASDLSSDLVLIPGVKRAVSMMDKPHFSIPRRTDSRAARTISSSSTLSPTQLATAIFVNRVLVDDPGRWNRR